MIKISKLKYFNGKEYVEPKMKIFDSKQNDWVEVFGGFIVESGNISIGEFRGYISWTDKTKLGKWIKMKTIKINITGQYRFKIDDEGGARQKFKIIKNGKEIYLNSYTREEFTPSFEFKTGDVLNLYMLSSNYKKAFKLRVNLMVKEDFFTEI